MRNQQTLSFHQHPSYVIDAVAIIVAVLLFASVKYVILALVAVGKKPFSHIIVSSNDGLVIAADALFESDCPTGGFFVDR